MKNVAAIETHIETPTAVSLDCPQFAPVFRHLPPWEQLRIIHRSERRSSLDYGAYPRVQLRGDRAYLRALRAAELTAWEEAVSATRSSGRV